MPKMTKKGQQFVGREIGRMIRKGPGSGPQKGKTMRPKQAVATAMNVARKKGYKVPPRKSETVLYRDPEYGALAIVVEADGFTTYDHNSVDAQGIIAVLEQSMRPERCDDGGVLWRATNVHPAQVAANLRRAVQVLGYTDDPLAERAILQVPRTSAVAPDLPGSNRFQMVHEPLEAGLRRHIEVAFSALQEHGRATPPTIKFHNRPNATDSLGRVLPFVIARAFIEPTGSIAAVEATLREALKPVELYLVRATVQEGDGMATVEVALAPTASICEAYMDTSIPTFESHVLSGARTVWLSLSSALGLDEARDIASLAAMSTGAVGLRTEREGRAVVAHIPSSHAGSYVGDHAFQDRLGWLIGLLDPWDPEVKDIGEQKAIQAGAPSQRDALSEADVDLRAMQRKADAGDAAAAAMVQRMQRRAGAPDPLAETPPPSALDRDAIRELELAMVNDGDLHAMRRAIRQQMIRKIKNGTYRRDLAQKGWMYWVEAGAKAYVKQFGGSWHATFPKAERMFLAMRFAVEMERQYRDGELSEAAFSPTPGLVRAAFKTPGAARQCEECGLGMPKYVGRYPSKCPQCGGAVTAECDEDLDERKKQKRKKRTGVSASEHKKEALAARLRRKKMTSADKTAEAKRRRFLRKESLDEGSDLPIPMMNWSATKVIDTLPLSPAVARNVKRAALQSIRSDGRTGFRPGPHQRLDHAMFWWDFLPYDARGAINAAWKSVPESVEDLKGGYVGSKGKTSVQAIPKGSVARAGQPSAPDDAGDDDLLARLRRKREQERAKAEEERKARRGKGYPAAAGL